MSKHEVDSTIDRIGQLVTWVASTLAQHPDDVEVEAHQYDQDLEFNLLVHQEDMKFIIGRNGDNIRALRALVKASSTNPHAHVALHVDSWQEIGDGLTPTERGRDDQA